MVAAAGDRLARALRDDATTASSVEVTARMNDLSLEVEGYGRVQFPVTPAKARKLAALGQPARFGRGAETLTDPDVRDTWEIPKNLVQAEWDEVVLKVVLATVKDELGLPSAAELTAELHSFLVYEPNQFFLAHQDSEKDDSMVGTLVVTLPSAYTGGELMVGHDEEWKAYRGSKTALSLVAFYADCRHEVLKVKSGYRITLTYNLLMHGDTRRPESDEGTIAELAGLLREHFSTAVPAYYDGPATDIPKRLVFLLDREYTPRGLSWAGLKGADGSRVSLLRAAADRAGCETVLALADIKTTHSAFADDDDDDYDDYDGDDDEYCDEDENVSDASDYDIHELIDSEVTLTHWTQPDGTGLAEISLHVPAGEVCAVTPTGALEPRDSEYEGYMGNWGNTLDRWYHRAAVVVWPRAKAFANRAETSPAWALDELASMASSGRVRDAQAAAATLTPFWDNALRGRTPVEKGGISGIFAQALRAADAVADASTAAMLLHPFRVEDLTDPHLDAFATLVGGYGQRWTANLLGTWFGRDQPAWAFGGTWAYGNGRERPQWVTDCLPGLCARLRGTRGAGSAIRGGTVAAQRLLDLAWEWLEKQIRAGLALVPPSRRAEQLGSLGGPLAAVLTAAAAVGSASTRDAVTGFLRKQGDAVAPLEMSALRAAAEMPSAGPRADAGFAELAGDCAVWLRARLARPRRVPDDWSIELPGDCACPLCRNLRGFLEDRTRRTLEWPLAKEGRHHVHSRIDAAELPVTHVTRRQGRPYTLVLTKTDELFAREQRSRAEAEADVAWLAAEWPGRT